MSRPVKEVVLDTVKGLQSSLYLAFVVWFSVLLVVVAAAFNTPPREHIMTFVRADLASHVRLGDHPLYVLWLWIRDRMLRPIGMIYGPPRS